MNDDTDSENDLEDISRQEELIFKNCSPAKLWSLMFDIKDGTVVKDEIEQAMEFYCYLWEKRKAPPRELSNLIVTIFRKYLRGRKSNRTLEAAFGFTGKQGVRRNDQRNRDIATDVARYYLRGKSVKLSLSLVTTEYKLSATTISDAWRYYKDPGIWNVREERRRAGKDFTEGQKIRAEKIINQSNKKLKAFLKKTGT